MQIANFKNNVPPLCLAPHLIGDVSEIAKKIMASNFVVDLYKGKYGLKNSTRKREIKRQRICAGDKNAKLNGQKT